MNPTLTPRSACLLAVLLACGSGEASATLLTFDQARNATGTQVVPIQAGANVPQDYGDRVTGSPMTVPGGAFTYGNGGEGFTPNVVVDYFSGNRVSLWTTGYGDLENVLFAGQGANSLNLRFTADAGYEVLLFDFALAGWPTSDYTIDAVTVTGGGATLFAENDVPVQGDAMGPGHTLFSFATPLRGIELLIGIDFSNLAAGLQDNIGLDSIRFAQTPPPDAAPLQVPEPAALALFTGGLASIALLGFGRPGRGPRRPDAGARSSWFETRLRRSSP